MSHDNAENENLNKKPLTWMQINQDLQTALHTWEDLTQKYANRASPEEQQLQEMKRLLNELKSKMQDFE